MSEATALVRLQEIDLALLRHRKAAEELPQRAKVAAARAASKKVASELTRILGRRKDAEMELDDLQQEKTYLTERVSEVQEGAADPTDFHSTQDLEAQLSSLAKGLEKVEFETDRTLEQLEVIERAERNARTLQARLAEQEQAQTESWKAATADITEQVRALTDERERVVAELPADLVATYEKARKRFGGVAVETLVGNRPSACRVALQPSSFSDIRRSASEVTTCPYCKRILVVTQEA